MTAGRVRLWKRGNSGQVLFALALAISLVAHLWALSLLFQSGSRELGSVDVATAAISVNLESTDVIDAAESAASKQAASAPAGAEVDAVKQTQDKTGKIEDSQEQARLAVQANAERQRATEEAEIQEKVKEDAEREETKRRAEEATQPQKLAGAEEVEKKNKDKAKQASMAGGAGATGTEDAQQSQGRVSASQGSILNYGASLRALISSNAPRDIRKTSLRLAFAVTPSGGLASAGILHSSNDPEVDRRILDLVRKLSSRFPPPPPGASASQLSYNIEIIFR